MTLLSLLDTPTLAHSQSYSPHTQPFPPGRPLPTRALCATPTTYHHYHHHSYYDHHHYDTPSQTTLKMPPAFELRSGGDVKNKKQSVADLKYRRLTELNARLKEDLDRPRVKVSEASMS